MSNKHNIHKREDWISIVITVAFILGFLILANSGTMLTGFITVEPVTTIDFEVNSVIPTTSILEITSGTQIQQINLSEFTITLKELQNIQPIFENNSLTAYNITNITIDLAKYNIELTDSVTIRFIEIYKEITKELVTKTITKEETIITELFTTTENITEAQEENITTTEFETEEFNFTIQAMSDDAVPTADPASVPIDGTTVITAHWYSAGAATSPTLWLTEDTNQITNSDAGADFYCAGGSGDVNIILDESATCSAQADCSVYCSSAGNKDNIDIEFTVTAKGNDEGAGTEHVFRAGGDAGTYTYDSDPVTIEAGADETAPVVNLQFPLNETESGSASVNFTFNATDAQNGVDVCTLWLNKQGTWELNYTEVDITETVNQTINLTIEDDLNMLWRVECNDTSTNQDNKANSTTYNLTININEPPIVNIYWPENNTQSPSHSANFTYNVTDSDSGANGEIINCSLLLETAAGWDYNSSNATAITEGVNATINITLGHENINWTVQCEDAGGLKANATMGYYNYTVYDTTPSPSLVSPENNTYNISHSANFTYQVTSLDSVINCTLLLQTATGWEPNASNATAIVEGIDQSINITLGHENINWTIQCENIYSEKANATNGYFNYTVYDATPSVTLVWPGNNTYQQSSKTVNLTYNVTSPDSSLTCDLYINYAWNSTDTSIERGVNQTFNLTFDSYQNINWSVGCNNTFDEYKNSTIYNYSLLEQLNQPPTIPSINISSFSPNTPTVILDDKRSVSFTFVVSDPDGTSNLKAFANLTGADDSGNYYERNLTCTTTNMWSNETAQQYNCSFDMWYFYKTGEWNVSMNVTDGEYWAYNNGSNFNYASTTGITITPTYTSWSTIYSGQWNKTADDDPITINNTGNYNVSLSKVNVTAYNLRGEETQTEEIPAANFTVSINTDVNNIECIGTAMANATSIDITNSMLPRGNHSLGIAQEQLYICLVHVPLNIENQEYSTQNSYQWKIGIS